MGKTKKNRKTPRANLLNEIPPEDDEGSFLVPAESDEAFLEGIIAKLKSGKDEDREHACENICIAGECHISRILDSGLLRILSPLLLDPNQNVRRAAVGALQNLSQASRQSPGDVIPEFMDADVLTPLLSLFQRLSQDMDEEETFIQSVKLLLNLCESSSIAMERAFQNPTELLEFLLSSLKSRSPRSQLPVLQCLLTVSEDAPNVDEYLKEQGGEVLRNILVTDSSDQQKILAAGILINVLSSSCDSELELILKTIAHTLEKDHRTLISDFSKLLPSREEEQQEKLEESKSQMDTNDSSGSDITALLNAQETALEILTNLFCDNDDEESDEGNSMGDFDEDEMEGNSMGEGYTPTISPLMSEALRRHQFVNRLLEKAILPPEEIIMRLKESDEGKALLKAIKSLRSKAFLCLNNILLLQSPQELLFEGGDEVRLFEIWTELGTLCFGESGEKDASVLEAATSALRALTTRLCAIRCKNFSNLSFQDLNMMLELCKVSKAEIRLHLVHILGSIGALGLSGEVSKGLTNFLLETASRDSDVGVVAEALDKIFDMYAEDDTDELAVEVGLVPRLKGLVNGFKVKSGRLDKKDSRFPLVHTARVNLNRFIKYKSKRALIAKTL